MRFAAAGAKLQFTPTTFSGSGGQGIAGAGAMSTMAKNFATFRNRAPKYGAISKTGIAAAASKWRSAATAKAKVTANTIRAAGSVRANKIMADSYKSAAAKKASGSMAAGAIGMVGSIGAALLSDERAKHDIKELDNALSVLRELKPVTFHYNEEYTCSPERMHYGFIAQEYETVMPDQTYFDPFMDRYCIDTQELIAVLVKSVQELNTKVTRLEAKAVLAL
tara:strand:+ start:200 stop:865 length:666 start_codon:yes stop_codon:yes gene_type:complete